MQILLDKFKEIGAELRENRASITEIHSDLAVLNSRTEDIVTSAQLDSLKTEIQTVKDSLKAEREMRNKLILGTFTAFLTGLGGLVWSILKSLLSLS